MKIKNHKLIGFTLIEIIVVIFIIGLIVSIANISISKIREKGKDLERIDNIKQIQLALEMYRRDVGSYPDNLTFGEQLINPINSNIIYLQKIPQNPSYRNNENCSNEEYIYSLENNSYLLDFCLESPTENYALGYNCAQKEGIRSGKCFQCETTITYGDQNYNTILIGDQCWFAENLNIGNRINGSTEQSNNSTIEKYCYNNLESNCNVYGGLYSWDEAMQYSTIEKSQGICPEGWHVPTDTEFTTLTNWLVSNGGVTAEQEGTALKSTTWDGDNSSGFAVFPTGYHSRTDGSFSDVGGTAYFWSSSEINPGYSWFRFLFSGYSGVYRYDVDQAYGYSIRCLKD